jgi:predicted DNA-binding transcriptional regulator YafY
MPKVPESVQSRPPLERMYRLFHLIQQGEYPNCTQLAKEFEVSTRSIKRDVDFLKCRYHLPIEYDNQRYGYYFSKPVKEFPTVPITEAEMFALFIAHKAVGQYRGTAFEHPLETAFRKLTAQLGTQAHFSLGNLEQALSFRPFAPEDVDLTIFQSLTEATQKQRIVEFDYKGLGKERTLGRRVQPFHVACVDNRWYLIGHDLGKKGMRTFALTRMQQIKMTDKPFTRPADFDANAYLQGSFGIFKGEENFQVIVDFDSWAADLIRERKWHPTQQLIELPDGQLRLTMQLNNLEEVERWILSWGEHATVLEPKELRNRLHEITLKFSAKYLTPPKSM